MTAASPEREISKRLTCLRDLLDEAVPGEVVIYDPAPILNGDGTVNRQATAQLDEAVGRMFVAQYHREAGPEFEAD
jgi:hypothetical protein